MALFRALWLGTLSITRFSARHYASRRGALTLIHGV